MNYYPIIIFIYLSIKLDIITMKREILSGYFWLTIGFLLLINGLSDLFRYSSGDLFNQMLLIKDVYCEIICGAFLILLGYYYIKQKSIRYLFVLLLIMIILLIDIVIDYFSDYRISSFRVILAILLAMYFANRKVLLKKTITEIPMHFLFAIIVLVIGLSTYLWTQLFPYEAFSFLHDI